MERKLIQQGKDSYTITVPRWWVRKHGLEDATIQVEKEGQDLFLRAPEQESRKSCSIDAHGYNERTLRNILNQHYRKGYIIITLNIDGEEQLEIIEDLCERTMLGFDVVQQSEESVTLEEIAAPSPDRFSTILRRLFLIIKQEGVRITDDMRAASFDAEEAQSVKDKVDEYTNYCRRTLRQRFTRDDHAMIMLYKIVSRLSLIHHAYYYMQEQAQEYEQISARTVSLLEEANDMYDDFYTCLYQLDLDLAHEIGVRKDELIFGELYDALHEDNGEGPLLYHIGEIIRLVHMQSTNVFSLPYAGPDVEELFTEDR